MCAQYLSRSCNKLVTIWVLENYTPNSNAKFLPFNKLLNFGRYDQYLRDHPAQVFHYEVGSLERLCLSDKFHPLCVFEPTGVVLRAPSGRYLYLVEVLFSGDVSTCIDVMNSVYTEKFSNVSEKSFSFELTEHFHQILTLAAQNNVVLNDGRYITELIYRFPVDDAKALSDEAYPREMNIRRDSLTAVSRFVTILYAPQDYMENSVYLSAATTITSIATIEKCRRGLFDITDRLQRNSGKAMDSKSIIGLSGALEDLVTEFLLNVEEPRFIGLLVPSLRLENFHECLSIKSQIDEKRSSLSTLFEKLSGLIDAKKTQLEELRVAEDNSRRLCCTNRVKVDLPLSPDGLMLRAQ